MWPFSKKKKKDTVFQMAHTHTWKDMPWYMEEYYNPKEKTAEYSIIEPYICITCGERENKVLERQSWTGISVSERERIYEEVRNKYKKYLKPRAIIEDMINNILLVKDPNYLNMVETQRGLPYRNCGTSSDTIQTADRKHYKIEVNNNEVDSRKVGN